MVVSSWEDISKYTMGSLATSTTNRNDLCTLKAPKDTPRCLSTDETETIRSDSDDERRKKSAEKSLVEVVIHPAEDENRVPCENEDNSLVSQLPGPPPDGGSQAWLQVVVGHLVIFNSWGYISAFGVFQAYYETTLQRPPSDISWIGSFQTFLIYFMSTFSGRATDAGYYRYVLTAGLSLQVFGVFMTSISTQYWQIFLAQGICIGIGDGLVFCPTVTLISTYFLKKRALAISGIANGFVTGGVVYTIIARQLLYRIGFAWTCRAMGFVMLANAAIILSLARTRIPPRVTGPLIEFAAFKEASYDLFSLGMFLAFLGVYFGYYYVCHDAFFIVGYLANEVNRLRHLRNKPSDFHQHHHSTFYSS